MRRRARHLLAIGAITLAGGCAYYNALYNARRLYRDAEAATDRGEMQLAQAAYRESLDKAARSLGRDPDGRWADDALLLIAQNHFALGDCPAAGAALTRVLAETRDPTLAARARAYLGAAAQCMEDPALALQHLDAAIPELDAGSPVDAFARLWRARALFDLERADSAWADLAVASARQDALGRAARLEQIARSLGADRRDRALEGFHALFADPAGDLHADTLTDLVVALSDRWGGEVARAALEPAHGAPWSGEVRDRFVVERARQAAIAGDTATALRELQQAASRSTSEAANDARIAIARIRLATLTDPTELEEVRATLLPALGEQSVRRLVNSIAVLGSLLTSAQAGQPLALFAAAEIARDRLGADPLARRLFVAYADVAGSGPWSTKAILAALALGPSNPQRAELEARLRAANDVYAAAARGSAAPGFEDSEARLDQALVGMIARAERDATERDVSVGVAIAEMDSLTAAVRADSVALACGVLADSLGLAGIRRDSVSAACLRSDVAVIDSFLRIDTLAWADSAAPARQPVGDDDDRPGVE